MSQAYAHPVASEHKNSTPLILGNDFFILEPTQFWQIIFMFANRDEIINGSLTLPVRNTFGLRDLY